MSVFYICMVKSGTEDGSSFMFSITILALQSPCKGDGRDLLGKATIDGDALEVG